jgi:hypothetical protein
MFLWMLRMLPLLLRVAAATVFILLLLLPMRPLLMLLRGGISCSRSSFPVSLGCA